MKLNNYQKINVENALQCAKQQLIETIIQTGRSSYKAI